jgi:3-hydroxyisobutyrate dehydrogenase-like beta-hydroxyacid dehydrogenase
MPERQTIGFIGLGVMGEPMCRNLLQKSGLTIRVFDLSQDPLQRLGAEGAVVARSPSDLAEQSDLVFMSLPSGSHVESVCQGDRGLVAAARRGQTYVDLGTSPVSLARKLDGLFGEKSASFADAPVARTREAAIQGTLSIMVGASAETFARIQPLLRCMATDVTHCGDVGAGQVVKIVNNMVLVETVNALAEALALGRRAGVDPTLLFATLSKGSADSFALRNHGMKAMVPGHFPQRAFSSEYALKDLGYALELAKEEGLTLRGAGLAAQVLREAIAGGHGADYFPVLSKVVEKA